MSKEARCNSLGRKDLQRAKGGPRGFSTEDIKNAREILRSIFRRKEANDKKRAKKRAKKKLNKGTRDAKTSKQPPDIKAHRDTASEG